KTIGCAPRLVDLGVLLAVNPRVRLVGFLPGARILEPAWHNNNTALADWATRIRASARRGRSDQVDADSPARCVEIVDVDHSISIQVSPDRLGRVADAQYLVSNANQVPGVYRRIPVEVTWHHAERRREGLGADTGVCAESHAVKSHHQLVDTQRVGQSP